MSTMGKSSESILALTKIVEEKKQVFNDAKNALEKVSKAATLYRILQGKANNSTIKELKQHYSHYFDEESGNTHKEGLAQLDEELRSEFYYKRTQYHNAKKRDLKCSNIEYRSRV